MKEHTRNNKKELENCIKRKNEIKKHTQKLEKTTKSNEKEIKLNVTKWKKGGK